MAGRGGGPKYRASDFRSAFRGDRAIHGPHHRHKLDCELLADVASSMPGPRYSDPVMRGMRHELGSPDGHKYHGTVEANRRDRAAVATVREARAAGEPAVLGPHAAAHIRSGAEFMAAHKSELPPGLVRAYAGYMAHVVDKDGHKVVDARTLRVSGGAGGR